MVAFPFIYKTFIFFALTILVATSSEAQEAETEKYVVIGKQGESGAYSGTALLTRTKGAFRLDWDITAPKKSVSQGFGLIHHQRMAAVFGQQAKGLMIFSLHDKVLMGKTVSKENPDKVINVKLELVEGTPTNGVFVFTEGGVGEMQIAPVKDNPLECSVIILGEKFSRVEGLGLWTGEVLQVAPAYDSGELGLMSFTLGRDDAFHGVWTSGNGIAMETLKPSSNKKPTPDPRGLPFDKQAYFLAYNVSRPGEQVNEEREYLRLGEVRDNFSKKIIMRRYDNNQFNAADLNHTLVLAASEGKGLVSSQVLESSDRLAGHTLIFKNGKDRIFHLVFVHRDEMHLVSTHLIVANRFDLDTEDRFAEHITQNLTQWAEEIRKLSTVTSAFMRITSTMPEVDTSKSPEKPKASDEKK